GSEFLVVTDRDLHYPRVRWWLRRKVGDELLEEITDAGIRGSGRIVVDGDSSVGRNQLDHAGNGMIGEVAREGHDELVSLLFDPLAEADQDCRVTERREVHGNGRILGGEAEKRKGPRLRRQYDILSHADCGRDNHGSGSSRSR